MDGSTFFVCVSSIGLWTNITLNMKRLQKIIAIVGMLMLLGSCSTLLATSNETTNALAEPQGAKPIFYGPVISADSTSNIKQSDKLL